MTEHLQERARQALELTEAERIQHIRSDRWIGYSRASDLLKKLEDLLHHPKTHRMPNMVIVGETNNGKTKIVNEFRLRHPPSDNRTIDAISAPVLVVQAPSNPTETRFYGEILHTLYAPMRPSSNAEQRLLQVLTLFKAIGIRVLVIDEIHHIIAGSLQRQRVFLNTIKYLGNELQIPIVGVGTSDALHALQSDPQLANRFEPVLLPRWKFDEEFLRLLASFEAMLPLRERSDLVETTLAATILGKSEGTIGEIATLLTRAAVLAVETKRERIDAKLIEKVDYVTPSQRKRRHAG
ncbi:MAG TPA: TniB family NTP-binding protein [Candidatus Tumulicola sp.]